MAGQPDSESANGKIIQKATRDRLKRLAKHEISLKRAVSHSKRFLLLVIRLAVYGCKKRLESLWRILFYVVGDNG
jgi:hypothetical protein